MREERRPSARAHVAAALTGIRPRPSSWGGRSESDSPGEGQADSFWCRVKAALGWVTSESPTKAEPSTPSRRERPPSTPDTALRKLRAGLITREEFEVLVQQERALRRAMEE